MERRLTDALGVYVDAMRYPRGTEDQRSSMWLEHNRRNGWKAGAAEDGGGPPAASTAPAPPREGLEGGRRSGRGGPSRRDQRHGRRAGGGADRGSRLRLLRGAGPVVATA